MEVLNSSTVQPTHPTAVYEKLHFPQSSQVTLKDLEDCDIDDGSDIVGSSCSVDETADDSSRPYPLPPRSRPNNVLPEDLKTPDFHVPRDPRLIRLTGIHPFNVEAPLSALYDEGFLTTKDLHYVRNHGPVPQVQDEDNLDWEFTIDGLVERPAKLTLRDLLRDYEQLTYPITLVCAGNRRKEQNVVRKTKGFSWGPAGVSTALWTGVALGDLLMRAIPQRGAKYVCFEGADKLPNGYYGTSVKLSWALDGDRGMMLAHKMNGEDLAPDHGKPLRVVIPGQIGGRSVKWLKKMIVTAAPSDNWYHIYDNRVLPTMITPEASADLPEMWKDERHAIYDLNTNSATVYPAHDETLPVGGDATSYSVRGYAYAGGGRRISRVELTLDKGRSWTLTNIKYPEDDYRLVPDGEMLYGGRLDMARETSFCWCFWDIDVAITQLQQAGDIMVRAMDDSMMVQPRDMYWSVLGMMNNPWYRIVIHHEAGGLRFEHPTQPALMPGGWMERVKKAGGNITNGFWGERAAGEAEVAVEEEPTKEVCMTKEGITREVQLNELREHEGDSNPWFVVNGQVYDGTEFLKGHPGGAASIIGAAGQDVTEEFMTIHSENAKAMMPKYHIGSLDQAAKTRLGQEDVVVENTTLREIFLQSKAWSKAILTEKKKISADTKIFSFSLDHEAQMVGLPIGQHLMMRLRDPASREAIIRAYTPISEGTDKGKLHVLVKIYYDTPDRKGGKMTQALDSIPIGHFVDFKGPVGKFEYLGKGLCTIGGRRRQIRRFVMVCAGSGITPIFQVLRAVLKDPHDATFCHVLYGNRSEEDILCRAELDAMSAGNGHKCRLRYSLSKPHVKWQDPTGRMDKSMFLNEVGGPSAEQGDALVLICGPESMEKSVLAIFTEMGWAEHDLLFF